jgi:hypothetical protein
MNLETFGRWLETLKQAWEERDPQAAVNLFSTDAVYRETPFEEPMRGRQAILEYWSHVPKTQDHVKFDYQMLEVSEERGIARWQASFQRIPTKTHVKLDGIMVVQLNAENQCVLFEERWRRQEQDRGAFK